MQVANLMERVREEADARQQEVIAGVLSHVEHHGLGPKPPNRQQLAAEYWQAVARGRAHPPATPITARVLKTTENAYAHSRVHRVEGGFMADKRYEEYGRQSDDGSSEVKITYGGCTKQACDYWKERQERIDRKLETCEKGTHELARMADDGCPHGNNDDQPAGGTIVIDDDGEY